MLVYSRRTAITGLLALYSSCLVGALGCASTADESDVASASAALRESSLAFEVSLRGQSPVQIHARVWSGGARAGATVLAVHGVSETGAIFAPLAGVIFEDRALRRRVQRVIAIDLPGHGESAAPAASDGLRFGDLTIEDYVGVVLDSIRALRAQRLAPSVLIGHSLGGLEVQAAQETLLAQGSSLARLGIRRAILLAPVPPHGQPWQLPAGDGGSLQVVQDPELGAYVPIDGQGAVAQLFGRLDGSVASNAPTPDAALAAGYLAPEPLTIVLQTVEVPIQLPDGTMLPTARPAVRADAFQLRNGTALELVSFEQDVLVHPADLATLYPYLTGDARNRLYTPIVGDDATHASFIPDPEGLLDALRTL